MKVVVYILSVLVGTALVSGGGFLVALNTPRSSIWLIFLATTALTVFVYGPLVLGSMGAYWDVKKSDASKRYFAWWYRIILALEVLAAVAIVVYAVLAGAPVWLPVLFIAVGAALTVVAVYLASWLRKRDEAHQTAPEAWTPITRRQLLAKVTKVALTFIIVFAIGIALAAVFLREVFADGMGRALLLVAGLAFVAAGVACSIVSLSIVRQVRDMAGRDAGRVRRLVKVVLKGKQLDLDEEERVEAAKYAVVAPVMLRFQIGYMTLLYIGLGIQQVQLLGHSQTQPLIISVMVLLVALFLVVVTLNVRYIRRARVYAREHDELLPAGASPLAG